MKRSKSSIKACFFALVCSGSINRNIYIYWSHESLVYWSFTDLTPLEPGGSILTRYGCFRNVVPPNHPLKNRVFHYVHPSILGVFPLFVKTPMYWLAWEAWFLDFWVPLEDEGSKHSDPLEALWWIAHWRPTGSVLFCCWWFLLLRIPPWFLEFCGSFGGDFTS